MVEHDYTHPLGHIVTAKYWQQVQENKLHMSVSDSGWAKFGWGKIYGQWICGAVIFAYDMDKFVPTHLLTKDAGLQADHILCTADYVPVYVAGRCGFL